MAGQTVTAAAAAGVLANDTDPDGDTITVTGVSQNGIGTFGHLSLNADGSYSYAADNAAAIAGIAIGTHGQDVFTYTEIDGRGGTATAGLTITIDRAPVPGERHERRHGRQGGVRCQCARQRQPIRTATR